MISDTLMEYFQYSFGRVSVKNFTLSVGPGPYKGNAYGINSGIEGMINVLRGAPANPFPNHYPVYSIPKYSSTSHQINQPTFLNIGILAFYLRME